MVGFKTTWKIDTNFGRANLDHILTSQGDLMEKRLCVDYLWRAGYWPAKTIEFGN